MAFTRRILNKNVNYKSMKIIIMTNESEERPVITNEIWWGREGQVISGPEIAAVRKDKERLTAACLSA